MSVYLFDSPVGYSKNPLPYDGGGSKSDSRTPRTRTPIVLKPKVSRDKTIDKLPVEIIHQIANELDQFGCLNFMMINKQIYKCAVPRLYQNIIIDQHYSQFSQEFSYKQYERDGSLISASYINSSYNFKRFLNCYEGGFIIKRFQCIHLPDSINIFDYDINERLIQFFHNVNGLNELIWLTDNFKLEFLRPLKNKDIIQTLILNIKFNNYLNKMDEEEVFKHFINLKNFQVKPFQNEKKLTKIMNEIDFSNLDTLKLSRFDKDMNVLVPDCKRLIVDSYNDLLDYELHISNIMFKDDFPNLSKLSLDNIMINYKDSKTLKRSIDFNKLTKLELKNISEYRLYQDLAESYSFLKDIAPELTNLHELSLDYRESYTDSVPEFINSISSNTVEGIDLTIRLNETKTITPTFYENYSQSLISNNKCQTLTGLSIEIKQENQFCDLNLPINLGYFQLEKLNRLQWLRLNCKNDNTIINLIKSLPELKFLHLFGLKNGSPNLGLGMIHPTVYDEWFKVQHVALIYLQSNEGLKYIRINNCTFECMGLLVIPRDGIDGWFNSHVRIGEKLDL